jgi:hypothetical protein
MSHTPHLQAYAVLSRTCEEVGLAAAAQKLQGKAQALEAAMAGLHRRQQAF